MSGSPIRHPKFGGPSTRGYPKFVTVYMRTAKNRPEMVVKKKTIFQLVRQLLPGFAYITFSSGLVKLRVNNTVHGVHIKPASTV